MLKKKQYCLPRNKSHRKKKNHNITEFKKKEKRFPIALLENNLTLKNKRSVETKGLYTAQILTITTIITMTMMLYK